MPKSKPLMTVDGQIIDILYEGVFQNISEILMQNRNIDHPGFFTPSLDGLHDPYLMPDMEKAVARILRSRETGERVIIFGDYDVDGVSSTAILFRFFSEIGIECSYRLPHRVHDGYGLKSYFFDELAEKNVKLVVTVDCGTRDLEAIKHAKTLGIDVIVTDHHAVPDIIPEEVIAIVNPKRKDSIYPFPNLAGAGVAFKLLHAVAIAMTKTNSHTNTMEYMNNNSTVSSVCISVADTLQRYIDFASLGTVADCMPLIGENRIITALGLKQMKQSESSALRKYIESIDRDVSSDADVIGFNIGPRINAAGRMDSPLKALHWLLATEEKVDDWLEQVESLNQKRQQEVQKYTEDALTKVDTNLPILFYMHDDIEHGLIGLVAGKLTETYGKPSIVLCRGHITHASRANREYESDIVPESEIAPLTFVASCRSPEWCNLVELLDLSRSYFQRYGGHRQAAGFTIEANRFEEFREYILARFRETYDITRLPEKTLSLECILPPSEVNLRTLDEIERFRPFGIKNPKPIFLLENLTIDSVKKIGKEGNHLSLTFLEIPHIKCLLWNYENIFTGEKLPRTHDIPSAGDILSPIVSLERNIWNGKESIQIIIKNIIL